MTVVNVCAVYDVQQQSGGAVYWSCHDTQTDPCVTKWAILTLQSTKVFISPPAVVQSLDIFAQGVYVNFI